MTYSETLRAMLKERGIEYETRDELGAYETRWCGYTAYQLTPESKLIMHPTPEQAIAATVGNGTDLSKRLREVHGLRSFAELFGFSWTDGSDWDWHDVACAMADAIDATVGADYAIAFAPTLDRPPETMVGETVFDSEGNAIGWITNARIEVVAK